MIRNAKANHTSHELVRRNTPNKKNKYKTCQLQEFLLHSEETNQSQIIHMLQIFMKHGNKHMQRLNSITTAKQQIRIIAESVSGVSLSDFINSIQNDKQTFLNQYQNITQKVSSSKCYQDENMTLIPQYSKRISSANNVCALSQMIFSNTVNEKIENDAYESLYNQFTKSSMQCATLDEVHQVACQLIHLLIHLLKLNLPAEKILTIDRLQVVRDQNNQLYLKLVNYFDIDSLTCLIEHYQQAKKHQYHNNLSNTQKAKFKELQSLFQLIFIPEYKRYGLISENINKVNKFGYLLDHQLSYKTAYLLQSLYVSDWKISQLHQLLEMQKYLPTLSLSDVVSSNSRNFYVKIMLDGNSHRQIQNFINYIMGAECIEQDIYTTSIITNSIHIQLVLYNKYNFSKQQLMDVTQDIDIYLQLYSSQPEYDVLNTKQLNIRAINSRCEFFQLYIYNNYFDKELQMYAHYSFGQCPKRSLILDCLIHFIHITYTNKKYS